MLDRLRRLSLVAALAYAPIATVVHAEALSLDSCLAIALARNPDVHAADFDFAAAAARARQAGAWDPLSASWSVAKLGSPLGNSERDESIRLNQDIPGPGQRSGALRVARAERDRVGAERDLARLRLRGDVIRAYRRLQAETMSLRSIRELGGTARDLEQMIGIRLRSGGARYLDVLRARSERSRIENDAIEAERALLEERRTLNALLGREIESGLEAADSLAYTPLDVPLDSVLSRARRTRPGLAAARLQLAREEAFGAHVRASRWPALSASAGWDRVAGVPNGGFGGEIGVSLPFLPWTAARARSSEATALRDAAGARLRAADRSLETRLRNAYASARTAEVQVRQFEDLLLADGRDAIRTAIQNYQAGQIEGLELFETLRTLRSIQLEHIRALLNYELALTDLEVEE